MDSITYIYLEGLSVFRSGHKLLSNTPSNLDTGQRPLNRQTTDYCKAALTLPPACCLFYRPQHLTPPWRVPCGATADPQSQPVQVGGGATQRSDIACVHSCCYLPFQREICAFIFLQITQKSLFTSSRLLCNMHHHPGLPWIWPTNFKWCFIWSYQIFFWWAVFRSTRLSYQILSLFLLLRSGCFQMN